MNTKILITNLSQLKAKYGNGISKIRDAIKDLISADKARGIKTELMFVNDASNMQKVNASPVTNASSPRQNKVAVDAIYKELKPDFLVLLGGPDVIPHQDLKNPIFGGEDQDRFAWGDIPYACEAPYSQEANDFIGPTRVVGRIPDITAGKDPDYFVGVLKTAAKWRPWQASDYANHLGISADEWKRSTQLSLQNTFGKSNLQLSPPRGPQWAASLFAHRPHFINCHGAPSDPHYYGQHGNNYPIAHDASWVNTRVSHGTVAAVECCYGAELYDPAPVANNQIGICSTYFQYGAYGFFGSTTIAYGPAAGNGSADLICQYFLQQVLAGASLGRAALEARQQFARSSPELDPADIKTIAQFNLLGDPSIQPVKAPAPPVAVKLPKGMRAFRSGMDLVSFERHARRRQLIDTGIQLTQMQAVASKRLSQTVEPSIDLKMRALAEANGIKSPELISFSVERPALSMATSMKGRFKALVEDMPAPNAFHVAIGKVKTDHPKVINLALLVAKEQDGQLVSVRKLLSR